MNETTPTNIVQFDQEEIFLRQFREAYIEFSQNTARLGARANLLWKQVWDLKLRKAFPGANFRERVRVATLQNGTPPEHWEKLFQQLKDAKVVVESVEYDPTTNNFALYGHTDSTLSRTL